MSGLYDTTYNPDVLSCLANLSSDEVFTPPEMANQMRDGQPNARYASEENLVGSGSHLP